MNDHDAFEFVDFSGAESGLTSGPNSYDGKAYVGNIDWMKYTDDTAEKDAEKVD